ncbi:MAG: STT3 domain-containing protein, partial [Methanomicrobiaceae archaeon]|nr:STT3 domain-containing protein [Methanomicrobiaceae archaeon]
MITLRRRTAGALAGILLAALALRLSTFSQVFLPGGIRFIEPDAYYHMRRIVLAAGDFPGIISFDTYIDYPQGFSIGWPPLFDGIVAACAALLGLGDPSVSLVETVGALFPVVIGLLTVIPVYLIAREIFSSEEIGIAAAGILAILPAHVIASLLGFVDHHVVETFLFSLMILFHVLALRRPERLYHWSALLGAAFLAAIYSFPGAPIYVGSIGLILIGQFVLRRMRDLPSRDLLRFGAIAFGIAAAVSLVVNAAILGAAGFSQGEVSLFQPAYLFLWLGAIAAAGLLAPALPRQPW